MEILILLAVAGALLLTRKEKEGMDVEAASQTQPEGLKQMFKEKTRHELFIETYGPRSVSGLFIETAYQQAEPWKVITEAGGSEAVLGPGGDLVEEKLERVPEVF